MAAKAATLRQEHVERAPFSTKINKGLIKSIKKLAIDEERDVYVLVEEALESFLRERKQ